jgi:hypothetical protein
MADQVKCFLEVKKGVMADDQDIESSKTDARTLARMCDCGGMHVYKPHQCEEGESCVKNGK